MCAATLTSPLEALAMAHWQVIIGILVLASCVSCGTMGRIMTRLMPRTMEVGPVIGILAQEVDPDDPNAQNYTSFIPASYIKAVEASGARVVPLFIRRPDSYYKIMLNKVNGVVYPGGDADFLAPDGFGRAARIILNIVLQMASQGKRVPLLGVCQGLEVLTLWSNNGTSLLTSCVVDNVNLPLKFSPKAANSSLFQWADPEDISALGNLDITSNHHYWCITEKNLTRFNLRNTWNVLSTSHFNGSVFISSMEMKSAPVAGVQFHPEKTAYEWSPPQNNPHTRKAVKANRVFYDWLVDSAKFNENKFSSVDELQKALIYNYRPLYTGRVGLYNEQVYYFNDPPRVLTNRV